MANQKNRQHDGLAQLTAILSGRGTFLAKGIGVAASAVVLVTTAGALYYRPRPDLSGESWGGPNYRSHRKVTESDRRFANWFSSHAPPCTTSGIVRGRDTDSPIRSGVKCLGEDAESSTERNGGGGDTDRRLFPAAAPAFTLLKLGHRLSQYVIIGTSLLINDVIMKHYNTHEIRSDSNYDALVGLIRRVNNGGDDDVDDDPEKARVAGGAPLEALLTISNHKSNIDDPGIVGLLLPDDVRNRPEKTRWSLCSQELCFKNPVLAAAFGAGKVLPIRRGAGIDQPLLDEFASKLEEGSWVHLFPEGKVNQGCTLGMDFVGAREPEKALKIGRLKWGVGKLIAHTSTRLHVVPIYHVGMETILPLESTGVLSNPIPRGKKHVRIRVGAAIYFDDLIAEHEMKHGSLRRYRKIAGKIKSDHNSTPYEMELYSSITRRIECALLKLEQETFIEQSK